MLVDGLKRAVFGLKLVFLFYAAIMFYLCIAQSRKDEVTAPGSESTGKDRSGLSHATLEPKRCKGKNYATGFSGTCRPYNGKHY